MIESMETQALANCLFELETEYIYELLYDDSVQYRRLLREAWKRNILPPSHPCYDRLIEDIKGSLARCLLL